MVQNEQNYRIFYNNFYLISQVLRLLCWNRFFKFSEKYQVTGNEFSKKMSHYKTKKYN